MALLRDCFALDHLLAPEILILRVSLRQIAELEALSKIQFADFFIAAADKIIQPPLCVGRRTFATSAEELLVLNLQRANVPLDLVQVLVDRDRKSTRLNSSHPS